MVFYYNNKTYEVSELFDIGGYPSNGIYVLFELRYCIYKNGQKSWSKSTDEDAERVMQFVNYFYADCWTKEELVEECKYFIDHEYDKNFDEGKYHMMEVRKAIKDFEEDENQLAKLEDAQSDLYDYIKNNIPLDQDED